MTEVRLIPLEETDREQFIKDNQEAFNYGALEEFGLRDDHFEEDGQIISRETIEQSIDSGEAYRIMQDGKPVGGVIIRVKRIIKLRQVGGLATNEILKLCKKFMQLGTGVSVFLHGETIRYRYPDL